MSEDILNGYHITLTRLREDKLELVRQWRNSKEVRQHMIYRGEITPEMQKEWFGKINNDHNFYYIMSFQGEDVGVMDLKDVDYQKGTAELGSLIWQTKHRGKGLGYCGNLVLCDFAFNTLRLNELFIHILSDNQASIAMHSHLGFILSHQEDNHNQVYTLSKEDYMKRRDLIIDKIQSKFITK